MLVRSHGKQPEITAVVWHGGMRSPFGGFTKGELLDPRNEATNPAYLGTPQTALTRPAQHGLAGRPMHRNVGEVAQVSW